MKTTVRFLLGALLLLSLAACKDKLGDNGYVITGSLDDEVDVEWAYLYNSYADPTLIDSTRISGGSFSFEGTVDTPFVALVMFDKNPLLMWLVFVEPGEIHLSTDSPCATGTPLNDGFSDWNAQLDNIVDERELNAFFAEHWNEHAHDLVGGYILSNLAPYLEPQLVERMVNDLTDEIRTHPVVASFLKQREAFLNMQPGKPFVDFELNALDGTPERISDYLGKGDGVLVDFWASWCGPCRREIPLVQEIVKDFPKLKVLGVALDEFDETRKAVEQLAIKWPVICDTASATASPYGFNAIPQMMLFDGDGNLVARDLNSTVLDSVLTAFFD